MGREEEIKKIADLVLRPSERVATAIKMVCIQGMGGQGKTMLASEILRRLAPRYPGGVLVIQRGTDTPEPVSITLQRWAERAGAEEREEPYTAIEVRDILAVCGQLLVLFDDVEPDDVDNVQLLREGLPLNAACLLTTRWAGIVTDLGGFLYPLEGLTEADARLLVESRILEKNADYDSSILRQGLNEHTEAIGRLIEAVARHPLAIELTIGRCELPQDLSVEIDHLVNSLSTGVGEFQLIGGGEQNRYRNLEICLEISLERLREFDEKHHKDFEDRFYSLGIFPGGADLSEKLIAAVWGGDEPSASTRQALRILRERSLIQRDRETGRYRSHPLLRAFARRQLTAISRHAAIRNRYETFVIETARKGFAQTQEHWQHLAWGIPHMHHVGARLGERVAGMLGDLNAIAAPQLSADVIPDSGNADQETLERAVDYVRAIRKYDIRRPRTGDQGRQWLIMGLAAARVIPRELEIIKNLKGFGGWYVSRDPGVAASYFEAALTESHRLGEVGEEGEILSYYGELERRRGRFQSALRHLNHALGIHQAFEDIIMEATTRKYLGETLWRLTRLDDARHQYEKAEELYARVDNLSGLADIINKIGAVHFNIGQMETAIDYFREAIALHQAVGNRSMEAEDLNDLGIALRYLDRLSEAKPRLEEALKIQFDLGNRRMQAITLANLPSVSHGLEDYEESVTLARNALKIAQTTEAPMARLWALNWQGVSLEALHRFGEARDCLEEALAITSDEINNPRGRAGTLGNLAHLLMHQLGEPSLAGQYLDEAIAIMETHKLERAFGGRHIDAFRSLRARLVEGEAAGKDRDG